MEKYNVFDCSIIEFDKHHSDRKGNLTVVQNGETLPFDVKRVYYLYDVPGGEERGAHAHRDLCQLMIAASGSFTVTLDIGFQTLSERQRNDSEYIKLGEEEIFLLVPYVWCWLRMCI